MLTNLLFIFLIGLTVAVLGFVIIFFIKQAIFATSMLHGAFFVPSADDRLNTMLKLAKPKPGEKIIDLGSGDGKIAFALAKLGYPVEGIEINPLLVRLANKQAKKLNLEKLASFRRANFWRLDFSQYDLIFVYGITYIMKRLEKKLRKELKPEARVVSNYFQFPNWTAEIEENEVRLYRQPN